jgi:Zinc knuckle
MRCFECDDEGHIARDCPNRAIDAKDGKPPWCGVCDERTRLIGLDIVHRCQECHPLARKMLRQFRRCPRCRMLVCEWDTSPDCRHHSARDATDTRPERARIREIAGAS